MSDTWMGSLAAQDRYRELGNDPWTNTMRGTPPAPGQGFPEVAASPVLYQTKAGPITEADIAGATEVAMGVSGGGLKTKTLAPEMGFGSTPQGTFKNWLLRYDPATGDPAFVNQSGPTGHAFSGLKTGLTPENMTHVVEGKSLGRSAPIDIADLQRRNAELVFGPTDRMYGGGDLLQVGKTKLRQPVAQEGGVNFPHMHEGADIPGMPADVAALYASVSKGAATKTNKIAQEAIERGGEPWYVPLMMSHGAGDSSKQMANTVFRTLKQSKPSAEAIEEIDRAVIAKLGEKGDYPGFSSKKLDKWLDEGGLEKRRIFTQAMDAKSVMSKTGVDIGLLRYANTDPRLYHTPSGSGGIVMGRMRPDVGVTDAPLHSNYPYTFMGQRGEIGGAPGNIPFSLLAPDMHRALVPRTNQGVSLATTPAIQVMQGLHSSVPKTQRVTQEVVDNWNEWFRRHPKGWGLAGAAPAGMGALAAQDRYEERM